MSGPDDETAALLAQLAVVGEPLGLDHKSAIREKLAELEQRQFLRLLPNPTYRAEQIPTYLQLLLGSDPPEALLEQVSISRRARRLSTEEIIELEERQHDRCALCGTYLGTAARPQVDHIIPLALGGADSYENLQLLCQRCNLGKHILVGWLPGAPFLHVGVSPRVRYCVLTRARAQCEISDCDANSTKTELQVAPRIFESQGGRLILDNLISVCKWHARQRETAVRYEAIKSLKQFRFHLKHSIVA